MNLAEPISATRCSSSGDRLHQSAAAATVGVVIIRSTRLEQGVYAKSGGTENAAYQFQRNTTSANLDEFTHVQRISLHAM